VSDQIQLEKSWRTLLGSEFEESYMVQLKAFLKKEKSARKVIYPSGDQIFSALDSTPVAKVRVVIVGQDPYHGLGQAHGLCFSVQPGIPRPPSLVNICKEIESDLGQSFTSDSGCLLPWSEQGVLLLNSVLTVEHGRAGSHQGQGWEKFTDRIITLLNDTREHLVFILWGNYALKKGAIVDSKRHCVLSSPHPSPLSAHRGFFGCRHFSETNAYLTSHGFDPIDWLHIS